MLADDTSEQSVGSRIPVSDHMLHGQAFRLTIVTLWDRTDGHDEPVRVQSVLLAEDGTRAWTGSIFVIEETANSRGTIFVRRSPMPESRPLPADSDLKVQKRGDELNVTLYRAAHESANDLWAVLPYEGGDFGRTRALQAWQRSLRPDSPVYRTRRFVINTWGDRSRDARITESFVLREIQAAQTIDADAVRIDDGWQAGLSGNSAFAGEMKTRGLTGFWSVSDRFWEVHPERFPNGLRPVLDRAKAAGIEIGLWYAPDSDDELVNWEKDAEQILRLHRTYGVRFFKIDGLNVVSRLAQQRIDQLLARVKDESDGNILLMLDITGHHKRPGFLGAIGSGNLFVQNRYTDWGNYWPHRTLRSLWRLSHWVDPSRLRFEFLNNTRNTEHESYAGHPLAPANYRSDYLFASVMMSNPLGWFEASNLPDNFRDRLTPLVQAWRQHRDTLAGCTIMPVGQEPSGRSWTGFLAIDQDGTPRSLLALREFTESNRYTYELPVPLDPHIATTVLHGAGVAEIGRDSITLTIDDAPGYVWVGFNTPDQETSDKK
ncbi:MAG: hypothetical protein AAF750_09795 [Planctomycetota bacterium]